MAHSGTTISRPARPGTAQAEAPAQRPSWFQSKRTFKYSGPWVAVSGTVRKTSRRTRRQVSSEPGRQPSSASRSTTSAFRSLVTPLPR